MTGEGITVYGASDDLIEIEGAIREEFYANLHDRTYLAFSNGTLLDVEYDDDGVWRIRVLAGEGSVVQAPADDEDNYFDVATLPSARWVVIGNGKAWNRSTDLDGSDA